MLRSTFAKLNQPVDIASLCALRCLFGCVLCAASVRFLAKGWVTQLLVEPEVHFAYAPWLRVNPLPAPAMQGMFVIMALFALGIACGAFYRVCCAGFLATFLYAELIDKALYLNHYYLVTLVAFLLLLLPADRALSVDAWRTPTQACGRIPRWVIGVLRLQIGVVYFFAGASKLTFDWLVEAQPLRIWLSARSDLPWIGPFLGTPGVAQAAAIVGAAFDLSIVFWLSWRKTRRAAFVVLIGFHVVTAWLFPIGVFPWLMTGLATVFFEPDWPRRWLVPRFSQPKLQFRTWSASGILTVLLVAHSLLQCLLPLRALSDPTTSAWTRRGFDFAWRVMLVEKHGSVEFRARDRQSGETWRVAPATFLRPFQVNAMAQDPELIRQAALIVADGFRRRGHQVAVYADAVASMNGRPSQALVNADVDLTEPLPDYWITPLGGSPVNRYPRLER